MRLLHQNTFMEPVLLITGQKIKSEHSLPRRRLPRIASLGYSNWDGRKKSPSGIPHTVYRLSPHRSRPPTGSQTDRAGAFPPVIPVPRPGHPRVPLAPRPNSTTHPHTQRASERFRQLAIGDQTNEGL